MCMHPYFLQSCPTHCDPMDCNLPGSSAHGIFLATILEWIAMPSSMGYLPNPGIEPTSLVSTALQVYSLLLSHWESPYFLILLVISGNANHNRGKIPILMNKNINKYIVKSCANKCCNRHALLSDLYL